MKHNLVIEGMKHVVGQRERALHSAVHTGSKFDGLNGDELARAVRKHADEIIIAVTYWEEAVEELESWELSFANPVSQLGANLDDVQAKTVVSCPPEDPNEDAPVSMVDGCVVLSDDDIPF